MKSYNELLAEEMKDLGTNPTEVSEAEMLLDEQFKKMRIYRGEFLNACVTDNVEKLKEIIFTDFLDEDYAIEYMEQSFVIACVQGSQNVVKFFLEDLEWNKEESTQNFIKEAIAISEEVKNTDNVNCLKLLLENGDLKFKNKI